MSNPDVVEGDRITKLLEALAKQTPTEPAVTIAEKPAIEEEPEFSEAELQRVLRRVFVFERRGRGDTVEEICTFLHSKGYPASRRTVFYDLRSDEVYSLIEELVRVQLRDIALLKGYALQDSKAPDLKAFAAAIAERGRMISCLKPKLEPAVKVDVNVNQQQTITAELLAKYEQLVKEGTTDQASSMGNISADNSVQPVDSSKTN
jgi:hypothetical protein